MTNCYLNLNIYNEAGIPQAADVVLNFLKTKKKG
jgi:hypothetical protein